MTVVCVLEAIILIYPLLQYIKSLSFRVQTPLYQGKKELFKKNNFRRALKQKGIHWVGSTSCLTPRAIAPCFSSFGSSVTFRQPLVFLTLISNLITLWLKNRYCFLFDTSYFKFVETCSTNLQCELFLQTFTCAEKMCLFSNSWV